MIAEGATPTAVLSHAFSVAHFDWMEPQHTIFSKHYVRSWWIAFFLSLSVSFRIILNFPKLSSVILCPRFYSHFTCSTTHGCRCLWHLFADLIRGKQLSGFYKSRDSSPCQQCPHKAINKQNMNWTYSRITRNALMCEFNSHYISQIHYSEYSEVFSNSAFWSMESSVSRWEMAPLTISVWNSQGFFLSN